MPTSAQLGWEHYLVLASIRDGAARAKLEAEAAGKRWSVRELGRNARPLLVAQRIENAPPERGPFPVPDRLLTPRKGRLGVQELVAGHRGLAVDMGFTSFFELSARRAARFSVGDFVAWETRPGLLDGGGLSKTQPLRGRLRVLEFDPAEWRLRTVVGAGRGALYSYRADMLRVVDGDTLWFRVHLAPWHWLKEKVRLRGVDCPELESAEGRAAKRFVEGLFAKAESVRITTVKSADKYDRYLADVFLVLGGAPATEVFLNNALLENGHAVRKDRFEVEDWE